MHTYTRAIRLALWHFVGLFAVTLVFGGPAVAQDVDHFMGYQAQETDKKNDALGKNCNVTIDDPCFGEKENLNVSKVKAIYLPAMKNDELVIDPNSHLLGYQVKEAKQGIGAAEGKCDSASSNKGDLCTDDAQCNGGDCEKTKFPKAVKHVKREAKTGTQVPLLNQWGHITVETNKRELLLVPTSKDLSSPPAPLQSDLDHYLCYKVKESKEPIPIPGTEPQQDEKGKLRKNQQVLVGDQFADGQGHPVLGDKVLYDVKKVTRLCNPVAKTNIDTQEVATNKNETRTSDCTVAESPTINNNKSLLCYQAKIASKQLGVCSNDPNEFCKAAKDCTFQGASCDLLPFPYVPADPFPAAKPGVKIDPKPKHLKREGKSGNPVFVNHQFGAPGSIDTKKELEFCLPTVKDPKCGDGVITPEVGEQCDDGNTTAGDGCNDTCQDEFCGDGIITTALGEMCDPPGSNSCLDGGVCSANCLCDLDLGAHGGPMNDDLFCVGGPNDGQVCTDPLKHVQGGCPPGPVPGPLDPQTPSRCIQESNFFLNTQLAQPLITLPLTGALSMDCGTVDPNTGIAPCTCNLDDANSVLIADIGQVCFTPFQGCPAGMVDCDGGTPLDQDVMIDHFITTCLGPDNDACDSICDVYCTQILDPGYVFHDAQCEGLCQSGPNIDQPCQFDIDCPQGSCAGGDPVEHKEHCNCTCVREGGPPSNPSRPGAVGCQIGVKIIVEDDLPCGDGDDTITLGETCIPITTELATSTYINFNEDPFGFLVEAPPATGVPGVCNDLATSVLSEIVLNGNIGFFDSALGDLQVPLRARMR